MITIIFLTGNVTSTDGIYMEGRVPKVLQKTVSLCLVQGLIQA